MVAGAMLLFGGAAQAGVINVFANGGFEVNSGVGGLATGWQSAGVDGYQVINSDFNSGSFSIEISAPAVQGGVALQNSVEDGGNPELDAASTTPTLSFWAKGGGTSDFTAYALRYLNSTGGILADSGLQDIGGVINPNTWTNITLSTLTVPVGATAAFIEFTQATGGVEDAFLRIDDVVLNANVVPVPAAVWLFGSGLIGLVGVARRKKKAA
jgi:hypothetical protein